MPKKKKKSRDSGGTGRDNVASPSPGGKSAAVAHDEPIELVDFVSLQIVKSSTPPIKTLRYSPTILLNEADAEKVGVVTGDEVFLFMVSSPAADEQMDVFQSAIAVAHVHSNPSMGASPAKIRSPLKSPIGQQNQRSKLTQGNCHVFPVSLAASFLEEEIPDPTISTPKTPTQQSTKTIISTPSPSKSKFSFAAGGGGDVLISTPAKGTPRSTPKESRVKGKQLMVVPVECDLGDVLTQALCHKASFLQVQEENGGEKLVGPLCERLVLAHTVGSYIPKDMQLPISFQGQSLSCRISDIGESSSSDELTDDLVKLSLDSQSPTDDPSGLVKALQSPGTRKGLRLFRIQTSTIVRTGKFQKTREKNKESLPTSKLVAGLESTVTEVESWFRTTFQHAQLSQPGLRPPKGLLLHGPGGTGKSALALQIVQNMEPNVHVEHIHCTELQSKTALVGQAERKLVEIFESAKRQRPGKSGSLVVLDDVHLICPRRQGVNLGADRLSSTLLALLDGVENESSGTRPHPLVILAITTNPSMLDPALRRPGRLDSEVEVPVPVDLTARKEILQFQLESLAACVDLSPSEWLELARQAKGFTGADLKLAAKEAIRRSAASGAASRQDGATVVSKEHLERAIRLTKPSAIKAVTVEIPQVQWSSIGGMEEAKRQLREAIELPLTHGQMFTRLGIQPPRGVLLYGPPGCSKTLMARALATEGHMNFLAVKGPELLSKWLGESERTLASLFKRARLASPSVIFFDEVDAIASKRSGNSSGGERLLSQMLTELDGIQKGGDTNQRRRVVVVCATNRPDLLDNALMRPGRIDRMIYVGVPDVSSRSRILEISLKGKLCARDIDIARLAGDSVSGGLSGAEMVAACRNAALMALEEDNRLEGFSAGPMIEMHHLEQALTSAERQITPDMLDFYASFQGQDQ